MIYEIIYKIPYFSARQYPSLDDNELNKEVNTVYLCIANFGRGDKGKRREQGTDEILGSFSFTHSCNFIYGKIKEPESYCCKL